MAELTALLEKQDNLFGYIDRFMVNVRKTKSTSISKGLLQGRKNLLDKYFNEFYQRHEQILELATPANKEEEQYLRDDQFSIAERRYAETLGELMDWIETFNPKPSPTGEGGAHQISLLDESLHRPPPPSNDVPRINVPKFDGSFLNWPSFSDLFKTIIDDHPNLSDVKKLQHLKNCLEKDAAHILRNVAVTNANYKPAWKKLQDRYENKLALLTSYLNAWLAIPASKNGSIDELLRVFDSTAEIITALTNMRRPVGLWDDLIVHITSNKLDAVTKREWQLYFANLPNNGTYPTFAQFSTFVEMRRAVFATGEPLDSVGKSSSSASKSGRLAHASVNNPGKCPACPGGHRLFSCSKFRQLTIDKRREQTAKWRICFNCFKAGHLSNSCTSEERCKNCQQKHHTMLHSDSLNFGKSTPSGSTLSTGNGSGNAADVTQSTTQSLPNQTYGSSASESTPSRCHHSGHHTSKRPQGLLATALIKVTTPQGYETQARVLLDNAADDSFVSERIVRILHLPRRPEKTSFSGLQGTTLGKGEQSVSFTVSGVYSNAKSFTVNAMVVRKVTTDIPSETIPEKIWPHILNLDLADPWFRSPGRIDMLLGVQIYSELLEEGLIKGPSGTPSAQKTALGWVLFGPTDIKSVTPSPRATARIHHIQRHNADAEICQNLRNFWELEELPSAPKLTPEEAKCEKHFATTHQRDSTGRYVVRLPL